MSDFGLWRHQAAYSLRGYIRHPEALVFGVALPVILLVLFNSVFAESGETTQLSGAAVPLAAYYTAGIVAYSLALACFSTLLITLVTNREAGRLKRYRGTPMPPWVFLAGQTAQCLVVAVLMTVVVTGVGMVFYDVSIEPTAVVGIAVYVLLGCTVACSLAFALSRVARTSDVASSLGPFSVVVLGFISGVFIPVATLPDWLQYVGRVFPLAQLATGLQESFTTTSGFGLSPEPLLVLGAWGIAALVVATRAFQWEPLAAQ